MNLVNVTGDEGISPALIVGLAVHSYNHRNLMAIAIGTRIGSHEITELLGKGGMGEVYRARDNRLKRDVALKVLPDEFSEDADRIRRFQREAQLLASLNHPNIAQIYGFEQSSGAPCIVMELVEGETIQERLKRGQIPLENVLTIAKQVAEALEAAHEHGILHRDLKPANIKLTPDGRVKMLDFGLAKAYHDASPTAASTLPTLMNASMPGVILGTPAYMSPEQAKGEECSRTSDIWAFGCVLYEMITGKAAFHGETLTEMLAAILKSEPDWSALPEATPENIHRLLRRCLRKDPKSRLQSIGDARIELDETPAEPGPSSHLKPRSMARVAWVVATITTIALVWALAGRFGADRQQALTEKRVVDVNTPPENRITALAWHAIAPDGRSLVVGTSERLWLRRLDNEAGWQELAGTEDAGFAFWSSDSRHIAFFTPGRLKRIDLTDGTVRTLLVGGAQGIGGDWYADTILFSALSNRGIQRLTVSTGAVSDVTQPQPGQTSHINPVFLPDGRHFLFYVVGSNPEAQGIYLGSLDNNETKRLTAADTSAEYLRPNRIAFVSQGSLVGRILDLTKRELAGEPEIVAVAASSVAPVFRGAFSISDNGEIAYKREAQTQLVWYNRSGARKRAIIEPEEGLMAPEFSPDGLHIAVGRTVDNNHDVWLIDLVNGSRKKLTSNSAVDSFPVFSPLSDGRIAFESRQKGPFNVYLKSLNGTGPEVPMLPTLTEQWPVDWSKDGRFLLYFDSDPKTGGDLWAMPMAGTEAKPFPVANTPFEEHIGQFSPNQRWVAYDTNESERFEVVVQAFPNPTWIKPVSVDGGVQPRWNADGSKLFFIAPDGTMMEASIQATDSGVNVGTPAKLFPTQIRFNPYKQQYDVSADGDFVINEVVDQWETNSITLLLNWKPRF